MTKGSSPCPVSGAMFDWSQEIKGGEVRYDKFGNAITEYKVTGNDEVSE